MRRRAILSVVLLGLTATLAAQTPNMSIRGSAGISRLTALTADMSEKTLTFTGLVIELPDGTKLSADEGTMNRDARTLELSGHVLMTFGK